MILLIVAGDECRSYQVLDQADRAMGFHDPSIKKCDQKDPDGISFPGWYRMMGKTGDQMPEKRVPINRCGTSAPGWLNGKHPTVEEGVVTREVCYNGNGKPCNWKNNIKIRNCGEYFVYELQKPPACDLRYCGNLKGVFEIDPTLFPGSSRVFKMAAAILNTEKALGTRLRFILYTADKRGE